LELDVVVASAMPPSWEGTETEFLLKELDVVRFREWLLDA
jgi:hypothetical protein